MASSSTSGRNACFKVLCGAITLVLGLSLLAAYCGNRSVLRPSLAERQDRLDRAIGWVVSHESELAQDANMPLWLMLHEAASIADHRQLSELVLRVTARFLSPDGRNSPWLRILNPVLPVDVDTLRLSELAPYQLSYLSAVTCGAQDEHLALPTGWRTGNLCRPILSKVFLFDKVCSTHQLFGLLLLQRQGCGTIAWAPPLPDALRWDIRLQLRLDPIVKDAYLQRVLMLYWTRGEQAIEPIWLRRVMDAQQPDGGWMGRIQFPELPAAWQPWAIRQSLARTWPESFDPQAKDSDFHATAQGLLLMALAVQAARPGAPSKASSVLMP